jgi:SAM-dependent methyltransferase
MTSASASPRSSLASAYSATAGAWDRGPARIYDRLAEVVVGRSPVAVAGASALDVGAGTGAAVGMLAHDATRRPPAAVADALALPFRSASFDVTVAAFSLNHLAHPEAGLIEAARVTRRGGGVLASAYAADDAHPVKGAVESTLADRGWSPDPWYEAVRREAMPRLATPEGARRTAALAGMDADVLAIRVPFPELDAGGLVAWRMGMAQHAPFVASLAVEERALVVAEAVARLGQGWPPLERSIILVCCRRR